MTDPDKIFNNLKVSGNLPSIPQVLMQLIDCCHASEIDLQAIATLVEKDASLSGKILQLANSAFIGSRAAFSDTRQAVVFLGGDTIKNLAISVSVQQVFRRVETNGLLSIDRFWYHSYQNAILAQRVAETTGHPNPSEAYLAGLLHDIGKLLLWMAFPGKYAPLLLKGVRCHNARLVFLEEEKLHINHCEAGAWLCDQWKLSSLLSDAIRYHHHPCEEVEQGLPLTRIVHLADLLSHEDPPTPECEAIAERFFGLTPSQVKVMHDGVDEQIQDTAGQLGIRIPRKSKSSLEQEPESEEVHKETSIGLINRVRDITQLTGLLENLLRAEDRNALIKTVEQGLKILFNEDTCMLLLRGAKPQELCGHVSPDNRLFREASSFRFDSKRHSTSLPGKAYTNNQLLHSFKQPSDGDGPVNMLDAQLLHLLETEGMAIVPMTCRDEVMGLIIIGLMEQSHHTLLNQLTPLQLLASHAGTALYLDYIHTKQSERVVAERLDAAGQVAKKIAHEINNPVAIIRNYIKILDIKSKDTPGVNKELSIIDRELERIGDITVQLKDLANDQLPVQKEQVDLNSLLDEIIRLFTMSIPEWKSISLNFNPDDTIENITTDPNRFRQIMINLISNSMDALGDSGNISITTKGLDSGIKISVEDNGPGIDAEKLPSIFNPGSTTKGGGHAGLGLAIVQKNIQELGGTISCDKYREGTIFSATLPVQDT